MRKGQHQTEGLAVPPPIGPERVPGGDRLAVKSVIFQERAVMAHPMGAVQPTSARKLAAAIRVQLLYSSWIQWRVTQNIVMQTNLTLFGQMIN